MMTDEGTGSVTNCLFVGNRTDGWGGGMRNLFSPLLVTGCVFSGNIAERGGAVADSTTVSMADGSTLINCTLYGNVASLHGGGVYSASYPDMTNCILWANAPMQIDGGVPVVNYSIIEGGWSGSGGVGVLNADPLFVDPDGPDDILGTADDNLRLRAGSPAVDSGDSNAVPADVNDLNTNGDMGEQLPVAVDGSARFADDIGTPDTGLGSVPIVDIGAYEFLGKTGDLDGDGDIDTGDVALFTQCLGGPGVTTPPGVCNALQFENADLTGDNHVDLMDFARLAVSIGG